MILTLGCPLVQVVRASVPRSDGGGAVGRITCRTQSPMSHSLEAGKEVQLTIQIPRSRVDDQEDDAEDIGLHVGDEDPDDVNDDADDGGS